MTIIGYTYDAEVHCVGCTRRRFQGAEDHDATDAEGNEVYEVLDTSEDCYLDHCADCHEPLLVHDCDQHGPWEAGWRDPDQPDEDSARFQHHDDAKRWLAEALDEHADAIDSWADPLNHDCEELGHEDDDSCPRQIANDLSLLAAEIDLIGKDNEYRTSAAGVDYWIKQVEG